MKKVKYFIISLVVLGSLFFLFGPVVMPDNSQFQKVLDLNSGEDVIIIFNPGGWGNTPLKEADDFAPIIKGIQKTLNEWGYNSVVIPYYRTKRSLIGKISGAKDFFSSFKFSSGTLAKEVEFLAREKPKDKIIIAGLSNGGALVEETMEKISAKAKNSVYGIVAGVPFWAKPPNSDHILKLDNNGKDSLSGGEIKYLILSLFRAPFKWVSAKINGENLTFSRAIQAPGHEYSWSSLRIKHQIVTFLESKFR